MKRSFILFLIFFSILFSCKHQQEEDINLKHLNFIAGSINTDFLQLKKEILLLSNDIQHKIPFDKEINMQLPQKYYFKNGEVLFCDYQISKSAVYLPAEKQLTASLKKLIVNSEHLDTLFRKSIQNNPLLSQVYFLDTNSFLRIYPFVDVLSYLKKSIDLRNFITYQSTENNPYLDDDVYWINKPFADPYGRGWVFSCAEPIYYRDRFIGIISGDITLRSLKEKYFYSDTEMFLLTDYGGNLICCTKEAAKIIDIPVLREFQYFKPVTEDIFTFNNPSLMHHKNKSFKNAIKSLMSGNNTEVFYLDNKKYTMYKSYIKETNWILFKIIN